MKGASEVDGRWMGAASQWCAQISCERMAGVWLGPRAGALAGKGHCGQCFCLRVWVFPGSCSGPVRGCPWDRPCGSPRPRTYGGQRRCGEADPVVFTQVDGHMADHGGAVCKTVGSAYVGSNPTPATTCENGPLAAETRPGGPFPSCHAMYQCGSPRVDAWQCARTYGVQRPGRTSGACNRSLCGLLAVGMSREGQVHRDRARRRCRIARGSATLTSASRGHNQVPAASRFGILFPHGDLGAPGRSR